MAHVALLVRGTILFNLWLLDFFQRVIIYVVKELVCVLPCSDTDLGWVDLAILCIIMVNHQDMIDFELMTAISKTQHNSLRNNYILI